MRKAWLIWSCAVSLLLQPVYVYADGPFKDTSFDFYGETVTIDYSKASPVSFTDQLSQSSIQAFYDNMEAKHYEPVIADLKDYKRRHNPDDWLYYQLIRKTAQNISPKNQNYHRYTLYKWYFLVKSGYDARITFCGDKMLLYVQCNEDIYDIPFMKQDGKQYICLNYHDYGSNIDFKKDTFFEAKVDIPEAKTAFSYKLTQLPNFKPEDYEEKDIEFMYGDVDYRFKIKLNPQVKTVYANYPVADYKLYFNTPLSKETYNSLIPQLKNTVKKMSTEKGVAYLMRFTRYAFLYEPDVKAFGKEKRMFPEQTLLSQYSDCEDRAALFFYLVKEIYNLPMLVLAYPQHVTVAVKFDKPVGKPIIFNGEQYSICEPTPQKRDLPIGAVSHDLKKEAYEVAYAYKP